MVSAAKSGRIIHRVTQAGVSVPVVSVCRYLCTYSRVQMAHLALRSRQRFKPTELQAVSGTMGMTQTLAEKPVREEASSIVAAEKRGKRSQRANGRRARLHVCKASRANVSTRCESYHGGACRELWRMTRLSSNGALAGKSHTSQRLAAIHTGPSSQRRIAFRKALPARDVD